VKRDEEFDKFLFGTTDGNPPKEVPFLPDSLPFSLPSPVCG